MSKTEQDPRKARLDQIRQENEEQLARSEGTQPTPTQDEIDQARLGVESLDQLDNKEPDGSPEQPNTAVPAPGPVTNGSQATAGGKAEGSQSAAAKSGDAKK